MMDVLNVFLGIILIAVYLVLLSVAIADYVMTSMGYYTIAQRRMISKPWLAWIPVARSWLIGSMANEYDERNGHKRKWNLVLLVAELFTVVAVIIMYISLIVIAVMSTYGGFYEEEALMTFLIMYGMLIVVMLAATVYGLCMAVCNFKIFESTVPEKALKYFILGLIVPLAQGICLLICRNKGYEYEIYKEEEELPETSGSLYVTAPQNNEENTEYTQEDNI